MSDDCDCNFCRFGIRDGLGHDDGPDVTTKPRCVCEHPGSMHDERFGCIADRCMNVCVAFRPIVLAKFGERPVFGVHQVMPGQAWTPEPLSEYWQQSERWKP